MRTRAFAVTLLAGLAASSAQAGYGDIIFTDVLDNTIKSVADPGGGNILSTLYNFPGVAPDFNIADIMQLPGGDYVVGNQASPVVDPSTSTLERVTDLFGTPSHSTIASSDPLQWPAGHFAFHNSTNEVLWVNNPGSAWDLPQRYEGMLGINPDTGAVREVFEYNLDLNEPRPRYQDGRCLTGDPHSSLYFTVAANGGEYFTGDYGDENEGSQLYLFDADAGTVALAVDLSYVLPGNPIRGADGLVALPGANPGWRDVYFSDIFNREIYHARFDENLAFVDIEVLLSGLSVPRKLDYNPFTNMLVWASPEAKTVEHANLDGSGHAILATGVEPQGFEFIPAPSSVGLLGLGGLIALRRRR